MTFLCTEINSFQSAEPLISTAVLLCHPDAPTSLGGNIMEATTKLQAIAIVIGIVLIAAGIWYVAAVVRPQ